MKNIDPRIAERRRNVAEQQARHGVRKMLWFVAAVVVTGIVLWIGSSPYFSVNSISVTGADRADINAALTLAGLAEGGPLILAPTDDATQAILADPWVADARVTKIYPDMIEILVVEHTPVARLVTLNGQAVVAEDASVVVFGGSGILSVSGTELPEIRLGTSLPLVGSVVDDPDVVGATEFFATLDSSWANGAYITDLDGELWAVVQGFDVRLGLPNAMAEKARSLTAVLAVGQPPGSVINVIAPARPTVRAPDVPSEEEG